MDAQLPPVDCMRSVHYWMHNYLQWMQACALLDAVDGGVCTNGCTTTSSGLYEECALLGAQLPPVDWMVECALLAAQIPPGGYGGVTKCSSLGVYIFNMNI